MRKLSSAVFVLLATVILYGADTSIDLGDAFSAYPSGCTSLYDSKGERFYRYNEEGCRTRRLPASSFKILNAMIGLETGVIDGPEHRMQWDGRNRRVASWNRDHDLRSAIRNSVVWYFEELARKVGEPRMQKLLEACDYGNARSGGEQPFWLVGDLAISTDEQVDFLQRLHARKLPLRREVMDTVCELLLLSEEGDARLYGKTGWTEKDGVNIGWFVGWVDQPGRTVYFATCLESTSADGFGEARKTITMDCLRKLGAWKE